MTLFGHAPGLKDTVPFHSRVLEKGVIGKYKPQESRVPVTTAVFGVHVGVLGGYLEE